MIALSWSRISDFRQCPAKFKFKYIDKATNFQLKDEQKSPALVRGGNIHAQLDNYVKAKKKNEIVTITLPEVLATTKLVDQIMDQYQVEPEHQIAIDENFKVVSWYDKQAYFRVIYDLIGFGTDLFLGDFKTGKFADYNGSIKCMGQLHLSALVGLSLWTDYELCTTAYIFVDHKRCIPWKHKRSDLPEMKDRLIAEHQLINAEEEFAPKQNQYCKWCQATREQCVYSKN